MKHVSWWWDDRTSGSVQRYLLIMLTLLFSCASASADLLDEIRSRGVLRWGADQEGGGPFVYPADDDPGRLIGFEVELAELIAAEIGVKAEFCQGQWDKLPDLVDRGDIDVVLNGYEWTSARADRYGVSIPYYIYELQLLVRSSDPTLQSWDDLLKPLDGRKRRVSVLGGAAAQDYVEQFAGDKVELSLFDGVTDALRATELAADGIDANVQDLPIWTFYSAGFPELRSVGPPVGRGYYVAIVRKDEETLLRAINQAIIRALQDGRLRKIFEKYNLWNNTQSLRGLETSAAGGFVGDISSSSIDANGDSSVETYREVRNWEVLRQRSGLLITAAGVTVALSVCAMPLAILVGLTMALLRLYGPKWSGQLATIYVEVVRGTPLVLQLYVIFFLLPEIGISINAFVAAVIGLALNYSAYEAEIYRAGLQAIPRGQMEAALSLGMSRNMALRRIIVPQATRIVIPPVTNDFIALFKDTAVCSVITVVELSKEYYIQARSTGAILELGLLTALLYLIMSYPLSILAGQMEKRLSREKTA
ncbi:MAG: ABC transporter permease subunit [Planctomyces sp.]|nr:ABC transporter permease subunit [Planctomyces sp.]